MLSDVGLVVNPKPGADAAMAGFGGTVCAVAAMLVLFWAVSPVFAQGSPCTPDLLAFQDGSGTLADPYEVRTRCHLQAMGASASALKAHYELTATIDAARTTRWNDGAGFEPIALGRSFGFSGSFVNRGNHVISSLYINRPNADNVGLFSRLDVQAQIVGVILTGPHTSGNSQVGFLAGVSNGAIKDCSVLHSQNQSGTVTAKGPFIGGLVGHNRLNGAIINSYVRGSVHGSDDAGGLVGVNYGSISNSSATASVTGGIRVGGLVGDNQRNASISNSSADGSVSGGDGVGGLVGITRLGAIVRNSYATGTVTGSNSNVGGLAGNNYGSISNSRAEARVRGRTNVGGLVGINELEGHTSNSYAAGDVVGSIEGTGGLAGRNSGHISDSSATATVSGVSRVGGLVGANSGRISTSRAVASVLGSGIDVGGLVGGNSGRIFYSSVAGSVVGRRNNVGGLVGANDGLINYNYAVASVSGYESVGGLVGYHVSLRTGDTTVYISNSYATGSVFGSIYVGGLVGNMELGPLLSNSFATGSVWGKTFFGGLVGRLGSGVIRNSYYARKPDSLDVLGQERTFEQLRCPTGPEANCPSGGTTTYTYRAWNEEVWDFGTTTELPQLRGNPNPDLNVKPYISGPVELILGVSPVEAISSSTLEADYEGPMGVPVTLTWSLAGLPGELRDLVYFSLANGTTATTTTGRKTTLSATRESATLHGESFFVVLRNGVSVNGDRIRVRIEDAVRPSIEPIDPAGLIVGVRDNHPGFAQLSFTVGYPGPPNRSPDLTWSLVGLPEGLSSSVYFQRTVDSLPQQTLTGSLAHVQNVSLFVSRNASQLGSRSFSFDVVLSNNITTDGDSVRIQVVDAQQPTLDPDERTVRVGAVPGATRLNLGVTDPGYQGDYAVLKWSLPEELPTGLADLVYFDLGHGTTDTEATGQNAELVVVRGESLPVPGSFVVKLENNISVYPPAQLRILLRKATEPPTVTLREGETLAEDGGLSRTISEGATDSTFTVAASDPYGDDFGGLSWSLVSEDLAPGVDVEFSSETMGDVVELRVTRPPGLYDAGSFVLGITGGSGAYTTVTIVIDTGCSADRGADLMSGQTGDGESGTPYQIERLCQLQDVRFDLGAHYELAADIDASPTRSWNDGKGFEPIASGTNPDGGFSGSFVNSSNYVITDLTINRPSTDNVALFSRLEVGAMIQDVMLMDSRTTGRNNVGSLVGSGSGAIVNSHSSGWVTGQDGVGGLVGSNSAVASVSRSSAAGKVSGQDSVGGLVGANVGIVRNNYAVAVVSGDENVGGLVGSHATAAIRNNYATGWVLGDENVGGLVGSNRGSLEFSNSYATGSVWGESNVGGLVGQGATGEISNSYYARGPDNNLGAKRSFEQLRCPTTPRADCPSGNVLTYEDWDTNVWDFGGADAQLLPQLSSNRNTDLNVKPYISGRVERRVVVGLVQGFGSLLLEADYEGAVPLTWSLAELPDELGSFAYFSLAGGTTALTATGSTVTLSVVHEDTQLVVDEEFYVVLTNGDSVNGDRVRIRVVEEQQPFIAGPGRQTVEVGDDVSGFSDLAFAVDAEPSEEPITWTWSLDGLPDELSSFVYFSLAGGTTATTTSGRNTTLSVTKNVAELEADTTFEVVLMNDVSSRSDSVQIQVESATPPAIEGVSTEGGVLIRTIWEGSADTTLTVEVSAPGEGDADELSWMIESDADLGPGASVEFSGSTMGGVVELRATRPLDLYDVGSFVLRVTNSFGAYSMVTVSIVTVCSEDRGSDLMLGQTGDGTSGSPYQIRRLCQLQDVRSSPSAYYELAADIDASPARNWNDGAGFEPIASGTNPGGGFSGSFVNSSSNYVITGLTIDRPSTDNVGLFARLDAGATIRDVILMDSRTTGRNNVGSLLGFASGVIEASYSSNGLVSGDDNVGGLVGYSEGSVSVSYATGSVTGKGDNVGGLVGYSEGSVSNSYADGQVSGNENVGGLVGSSTGGTTISYTYSLSTVTGTDPDNFGGLVGNSAGNIDASYFTGSDNSFGEQRTLPQMACPTAADPTCLPTEEGAFTYVGWNQGIWDFGTDSDFPKLRDAFIPITPIPDSQKLRIRLYLGGAAR